MLNVKRRIVVFGCAAAFAAAPLVAAAPASAKECPWGTVPTRFDGVCIQGQSGGFGSPGVVVPPQASAPGADVQYSPNELTRVNGIPCTPEKIGTCIALQQSQG